MGGVLDTAKTGENGVEEVQQDQGKIVVEEELPVMVGTAIMKATEQKSEAMEFSVPLEVFLLNLDFLCTALVLLYCLVHHYYSMAYVCGYGKVGQSFIKGNMRLCANSLNTSLGKFNAEHCWNRPFYFLHYLFLSSDREL